MRLGVVWEHGSNAQYRAFQPMRAMARRGHQVVWPPSTQGEADPQRLVGCDVVHVYRRIDPNTRSVVAELTRRGVPVIYDNDDDFISLPKESPSYKKVGGLAGRRAFAAMVKAARAAACFTTTTHSLAEIYRRAGVSRIEVIGNYLAPDTPRPRSARDGFVIGWVGGVDHRADVARIPIVKALERVLSEHAEARVECIGVNLGLSRRYRHDARVEFEELPARIGAWDVGIAPLADIPFNRARSDIKLKEYAISGVPWLASPVGPYRDLGEEQGGRLVADDSWFDALEDLITRPREHRKLARKAHKWARGQTIDAAIDRWEKVFASAAATSSRRAAGRPVVRIRMP